MKHLDVMFDNHPEPSLNIVVEMRWGGPGTCKPLPPWADPEGTDAFLQPEVLSQYLLFISYKNHKINFFMGKSSFLHV